MHYTFPHITHIDQVREAIEGREEFRIVQKDDYLVANYFVNMKESFPPVVDEHTALRRECRGILFCANTGKVLARRYHKFFNLGERPETQPNVLDFIKPHYILEKLDGSMITPFESNGKTRWGTKMGYTDVAGPVEDWLVDKFQYWALANDMWADGLTPIFEWCSRKQRIVIDYPTDKLVLTAIRNNVTGEYWAYPDLVELANTYKIDVVRALPGSVENLQQFLNETRDLKDQEGWIIRFDDGHMLKVKAEEYMRFHGTLDTLNFEKEILGMIARNTIDDTKAFMQPSDRADVERYESDVVEGMKQTAERLKWIVLAAKDNLGKDARKRFALEVANNHKPELERGLLFKIWEGHDPLQVVLQLVAGHCGSQTKVDEVRGLIGGVKWWDYRTNKNIDLDG